MSERLEPGRLVRWQHEGGWKVGHVVFAEWCPVGEDGRLVVQCPEGLYVVADGDTERRPTRKERGEV